MKKKTAVVFGTFAPLHQGHIDLIQRAKRQCDRVWIVVSGYEGDRGEQIGLTLQKRFRYIREAFCDDELTSVCKLDETNLPRYPMGWQEWLDQMLVEISYDEIQQELIFFVGERDYQQELSNRGFETVLQEKKVWYLSDYDSRKSKQILEIYCSTLPSSVYKESVDYGKCQQWEDHSGQGFGKVLRCAGQPGIRT